MVFTHTRPSSDEDESPMETANKILKRSREEEERLEKVNESPLASANRIILGGKDKDTSAQNAT